METELDRLKAWMDERGFDTKSLAKVVGVTYNYLHKTLTDQRYISNGLKWRFGKAFGFEIAFSIFDPPQKRQPHPLSERIAYPEQYAAHKALAKAIRAKQVLPAKSYLCQACGKQAHSHHHPSYHPDDHLCVVPLCRSCHSGKLDTAFGIVATPIGVLRIAIAGL